MEAGIFCIVMFVVGFIAVKVLDGLAGFVWKNTVRVLGILVGMGGAAVLIAGSVAVTVLSSWPNSLKRGDVGRLGRRALGGAGL